MRIRPSTWFLVAALGFQSRAWAGAGGTLDADVEYRYNAFDDLTWITADGRCSQGGFCFQLTPVDRPRSSVHDAIFGAPVVALAGPASDALEQRSLVKVSVPPRDVLIGEDAVGKWLVYDFTTKRFLVDHASFEVAQATWKARGFGEASFEDASVGVKQLPETLSSKLGPWAVLAAVLSPLLVLAAMVGLGFWLVRRRSRGRAALT